MRDEQGRQLGSVLENHEAKLLQSKIMNAIYIDIYSGKSLVFGVLSSLLLETNGRPQMVNA